MHFSRLHLLVVSMGVIFLASCKDAPVTTETTTAPPPSSPSVTWYRTAGTGTECVRTLLTAGTEQVIATFDTLPVETVWDLARGQVFFLTKTGVFRKDLNSETAPPLVAALPEGLPLGALHQGWMAGGNLRLVYSIPEWDFAEPLKQKFAQLSNGKAPSGMGGQLLLIYELNENGKWIPVRELASGMSDGPGDPLAEVRNEISPDSGTTSTRMLILESACADAVVGENPGWNMIDENQYAQYFNGIKEPGSEGYYRISINDNQDLIVSSMWGDLPHFCAPFFLYNRNTKKTEPFDPGTLLKASAPIEQYGIQVSGNYILLAREYDHDDVLILDKLTLKPVGKYRGATQAVILP